MTRSEYHELPAPRALADRLVCLWWQRIEGERTYHHSILPDGCVDVVWIGDSAPVVAGPATERVVLGLPPGTAIVGARIRPGWAAASLGVPPEALLNEHVPLKDVWKGGGPHVRAPLAGASVLDRAREATIAVRSWFGAAPEGDPSVRRAVGWLARHPRGRIGELARWIGLSERQLARRFVAGVGYAPKTFQRIMRVQRLLFEAGGVGDLAALSYTAGYADQAHMSREARALTGETPRDLLSKAGSTLAMSDLFKTDGMTRW